MEDLLKAAGFIAVVVFIVLLLTTLAAKTAPAVATTSVNQAAPAPLDCRPIGNGRAVVGASNIGGDLDNNLDWLANLTNQTCQNSRILNLISFSVVHDQHGVVKQLYALVQLA